jgi:hypothetical protein
MVGARFHPPDLFANCNDARGHGMIPISGLLVLDRATVDPRFKNLMGGAAHRHFEMAGAAEMSPKRRKAKRKC